MRHDSYAGMLKHVADVVVVGRDSVAPADDPEKRTVGFRVFSRHFEEVHFVALTASLDGLDEDQAEYLAAGQKGRTVMARVMQAGIPRHGHGFKHSKECLHCLASDVMES